MISHRLITLALGALMLTACAPQPTDPKSRFLRGDPCKPPCIEGIEPGVTTLAEAEQMLIASENIGADHAALETISEIPLLAWSYPNSEWIGRANSGLQGDSDSAIRGISVNMPDVCLSEIIAAYGDPDQFFLLAYQATGWVIVIWNNQSMLYSSQGDDQPGGVIESGACGGAVEFISADGTVDQFPSLALFADSANSPQSIEANLVEWQGIDHDYGEGEFEMPITP